MGARRLRRALTGGLTVVVEHDRRGVRGYLDLAADVRQPLQRQISDIEARVDVGGGVRIGVDLADLRAQTYCKAAVDALAGIVRGDLAAGELRLQVVKLASEVENPAADIGCLAAHAID